MKKKWFKPYEEDPEEALEILPPNMADDHWNYLVKFYRELKIFFNPIYVFECRQCVIKTSIVVPKTLSFTLLDQKASNNEVKKMFVYIIFSIFET